jgi:hypothetical protein
VTLNPFAPAAGEFITVDANDAVNAVIVFTVGTLAVIADKEKLIFCVVIASLPPNGK